MRIEEDEKIVSFFMNDVEIMKNLKVESDEEVVEGKVTRIEEPKRDLHNKTVNIGNPRFDEKKFRILRVYDEVVYIYKIPDKAGEELIEVDKVNAVEY